PLGDEVNGGLAPALIPSRGKGAHNVLLAPARAWLPPARASSSHPFVGARAQFHGQARFQSVKLVLDLRGHPVLAARRPRRRFWRLQVVPTHPAVIKGDPFFVPGYAMLPRESLSQLVRHAGKIRLGFRGRLATHLAPAR